MESKCNREDYNAPSDVLGAPQSFASSLGSSFVSRPWALGLDRDVIEKCDYRRVLNEPQEMYINTHRTVRS